MLLQHTGAAAKCAALAPTHLHTHPPVVYPQIHAAPTDSCGDDLRRVLYIVKRETAGGRPCPRRLVHILLDAELGRDVVNRAIDWLVGSGALRCGYLGRRQALAPVVYSVTDLDDSTVYRLAGEPCVCFQPGSGPLPTGDYISVLTQDTAYVVLPDFNGSLLGVARMVGGDWDTSEVFVSDLTLADLRPAREVWE